MKKTISIAIESIHSKELKKVQEARAAIRTLKEFADMMRNAERPGSIASIEAKATPEPKTPESEKEPPAFAYFFLTADVDELEIAIKHTREATDELESAIKVLEETLLLGITKEKPQE